MANNDAGDDHCGDCEIPELPEVPMRHILAKLPTADLLSTDLVSTSWSTHTQRETTLNRRSLCLYLGDETLARGARDFNHFDVPYKNDLKDTVTGEPLFPSPAVPSEDTWEHIKAAKLTDDLMMQLLKLFPDPASLIVSLGPHVVSESLFVLLSGWSGTLTSFKLYAPTEPLPAEEDEETPLPEPAKRLLSLINSMSSLRHLTVDWGGHFLATDDGQLDLPILAHLEELYFNSDDDADVLFKSLSEYGESNENLRVIALPGYLDKKHRIAFSNSADFLTRIKQLTFSLRGDDQNWTGPQPFPCFTGLTSLKLNIALHHDWNFDLDGDGFSFVDFLRYLMPLKQLVHLNLTLTASDVTSWRGELEEMEEADEMDALKDGQDQWLTVPSLKVLSLRFVPDPISSALGDGDGAIDHHGDLRALQLHRFFPSVQILLLSVVQDEALAPGFACTDCLCHDDLRDWKEVCIPRMVNSARHFKDLVFVEAKTMSGYFNRWEADKLGDDDDWTTDDDDDYSDDDDLDDVDDYDLPDAEDSDEY